MSVILEGRTLTLTGDVGDFGSGDYFDHASVVVALAQVEDHEDLTVHMNSGGGYVDHGIAIHSLLARRGGSTTVLVEGIAASAGSLIAMAGDTVLMAAGAVMMIHDPRQMTAGNSDDHAKTIEQLEAFATAFAKIYAGKSGKTAKECRAIMKAERWFNAEEAIAAGFADDMADKKARSFAAFDYRAYAHAPQELKALASRKNWTLGTTRKEEPKMTQPAPPEARVEATARIKAIMTSDEAKDRNELAEHLAYDTDITPDAAIAMLAKAGKQAGPADDDSYAGRRLGARADGRLNGEGLRGGDRSSGGRADLVAGMKRRHGIKDERR